MSQQVRTIIVGGGQAGLATSYCLTQKGHEHLVLEQAAQAGNSWRNGRWDSFTLVTPNWGNHLPGADFMGDNPDGFLPRDEVVRFFERYAQQSRLPVQYDTCVSAVEPDGAGYSVQTSRGTIKAGNVVIATGFFQQPNIPRLSNDIPSHVTQMHSGQYRNPQALPPGAVLVVGSAQSGCQIVEDLHLGGRKVYHSIGATGRAPRRYRGRDTIAWLRDVGFFDRTVDQLPSPRARFMEAPHLTGARGGHTVNLHQFARDGVNLLGHLRGSQDGRLLLAPDLHESLTKSDGFEAQIIQLIDGYIARKGLDAPVEVLPQLRDGYAVEPVTELDLEAADIRTVIWATGYRYDYSLVKLPVTDSDGFPIQQRGVTAYPGLYFIGLPWQPGQVSGFIMGIGKVAEYISEHIVSREAV